MVKIELSNFMYVPRSKNLQGKALRFTIGVSMEFDNGEIGEFAWVGNLAYYRFDGKLVWSPPISRYTSNKTHQCHYINPCIYNKITDKLLENPDILKHLTPPAARLLRKRAMIKSISEVDASLPNFLEAGDTNEKQD